jgi:hypothetical protein
LQIGKKRASPLCDITNIVDTNHGRQESVQKKIGPVKQAEKPRAHEAILRTNARRRELYAVKKAKKPSASEADAMNKGNCKCYYGSFYFVITQYLKPAGDVSYRVCSTA